MFIPMDLIPQKRKKNPNGPYTKRRNVLKPNLIGLWNYILGQHMGRYITQYTYVFEPNSTKWPTFILDTWNEISYTKIWDFLPTRKKPNQKVLESLKQLILQVSAPSTSPFESLHIALNPQVFSWDRFTFVLIW